MKVIENWEEIEKVNSDENAKEQCECSGCDAELVDTIMCEQASN